MSCCDIDDAGTSFRHAEKWYRHICFSERSRSMKILCRPVFFMNAQRIKGLGSIDDGMLTLEACLAAASRDGRQLNA